MLASVRSDAPCAVTITVCVFTCVDVIRDGNALGPQVGQDRRVVNQVAENGQRPRFGVLERQGDRVAYAEAHAEMAGANDVHGNGSNLMLIDRDA